MNFPYIFDQEIDVDRTSYLDKDNKYTITFGEKDILTRASSDQKKTNTSLRSIMIKTGKVNKMHINNLTKVQGVVLAFIALTVKVEVIDIEPVELPEHLETHKYSVVQFTSPDKRCGHCAGADKALACFEKQ